MITTGSMSTESDPIIQIRPHLIWDLRIGGLLPLPSRVFSNEGQALLLISEMVMPNSMGHLLACLEVGGCLLLQTLSAELEGDTSFLSSLITRLTEYQ